MALVSSAIVDQCCPTVAIKLFFATGQPSPPIPQIVAGSRVRSELGCVEIRQARTVSANDVCNGSLGRRSQPIRIPLSRRLSSHVHRISSSSMRQVVISRIFDPPLPLPPYSVHHGAAEAASVPSTRVVSKMDAMAKVRMRFLHKAAPPNQKIWPHRTGSTAQVRLSSGACSSSEPTA